MGLETDDDKLLADFEEALREVQATEARPVDKYKRKASQAEKTPCETRKKKAAAPAYYNLRSRQVAKKGV